MVPFLMVLFCERVIFIQIIDKNVKDLKFYDRNPRKNDQAVDAVAASIKEFGFKVPVIIDSYGVIVAGHTRCKAAKKLKMETVPCIVADDLTDEQIRSFRLADNKTSELSFWDLGALKLELGDIFNIDMAQFGFDLNMSDIDISDVSDSLGDVSLDKEFKYECPKCGFKYN